MKNIKEMTKDELKNEIINKVRYINLPTTSSLRAGFASKEIAELEKELESRY